MAKFQNVSDWLIDRVVERVGDEGRDLSMPCNPRYVPEELKPYFGYDMWVLWLAAIECAWLGFLSELGYYGVKNPLKLKDIQFLFKRMTTREQDIIERRPDVGHDINALVEMLGLHLAHHGLTSYDTIETARALMYRAAFYRVVYPALIELDCVWRAKIEEHVNLVKMGRTHLQHALPITAGYELAQIHNRFIEDTGEAEISARKITGKASGAVGTKAAPLALGLPANYEETFLCRKLGLAKPGLSTQITAPGRLARLFANLTILSGSLAQLGEDLRLLSSSDIGEAVSVSSTSSTMAHKTGNPITAENLAGMHTTVLGEFMKPMLNLVSDLERDLRNSSPARDYPAIMIYVFNQIKSATKLLKNLTFNKKRCYENLNQTKKVAMAELLYLALAREGVPNARLLVNKTIVPMAFRLEPYGNLVKATDWVVSHNHDEYRHECQRAYSKVGDFLTHPEEYLGAAIDMAQKEATNCL